MPKIVVLGAGIIGLYTTFELVYTLGIDAKEITIIAEYFPGDQSINYTSPWAGGNFSCITSDDSETLESDRFTYSNLNRIYKVLGSGKGLAMMKSTELFDRHPSAAKLDSLKSYLIDFEPLESLPNGVEYGFNFKAWNFNCPLFLSNLLDHFIKLGVKTINKRLTHISEAYYTNSIKTVFNCTGLGSLKLGGVDDSKVYPTRGQVVVIRAPHIKQSKMRWGEDYANYVIPRPDSEEVVLGGFLQKGNWTGDTLKIETDDILQRMGKHMPEIFEKPLDIIRVAAGLRPSRHGGVRIDLEKRDNGQTLIHNYGASGYGYQSGLGMASKAVKLFESQRIKL
ncbi:D-amino-acid oxidase [Wickerhamomyces ciferrii]|uniref:D-amino-acid oxidase n=1 Tax=Wickerhamomyces ciferrii (strain ATCC 14091 / BCRC 22168 / CBS 111 / JCM 3599 / NBRC 0793 / NRRL Y-1031 F-60-10) TaxID=1206466 RepID=K0KEP0_WICCF|nr:D-amino-acid oxidase [Wickerhamomyces ciferrii]CCH41391.1 D-amino-acid oxidase [Wickerhamomyces ciferrii]